MKNNIVLDLREFSCPIPIIETKKIIKNNSKGTEIRLLLKSENSNDNVSRMLNDMNIKFEADKLENHYEICFTI